MKYNEAYNKIIDAYFKDQIEPLDSKFCFCGTLNANKATWNNARYSGDYKHEEFKRMEVVLLNTIFNETFGHNWKDERGEFIKILNSRDIVDMKMHPGYEDALFAGMCAALDILKEIHKQRGENVDEDIPAFTKRELAKVH